MLSLITQFPKYCSQCGREFGPASLDFLEYETFSCPCGMNFQYADIDTVLEVSADLGGDLQYLDLSLEAEFSENSIFDGEMPNDMELRAI